MTYGTNCWYAQFYTNPKRICYSEVNGSLFYCFCCKLLFQTELVINFKHCSLSIAFIQTTKHVRVQCLCYDEIKAQRKTLFLLLFINSTQSIRWQLSVERHNLGIFKKHSLAALQTAQRTWYHKVVFGGSVGVEAHTMWKAALWAQIKGIANHLAD